MMKNAFDFMLKALLVLKYLHFCRDFLVMYSQVLNNRPPDYDATDCETKFVFILCPSEGPPKYN